MLATIEIWLTFLGQKPLSLMFSSVCACAVCGGACVCMCGGQRSVLVASQEPSSSSFFFPDKVLYWDLGLAS